MAGVIFDQELMNQYVEFKCCANVLLVLTILFRYHQLRSTLLRSFIHLARQNLSYSATYLKSHRPIKLNESTLY